MNHKGVTIKQLAGSRKIEISYSDNDVIIIDSVNKLADISETRINLNLLTVGIAGRLHCTMNGQPIELAQNQVIICPSNVVIGDLMMSHDFQFKAVFLTDRILQSFLHEKMNVWNDVVYVYRMHVWTLNETDVKYFVHFYEMLQLQSSPADDSPYRSEIIQSLLRATVLALCGRFKVTLPMGETTKRPAGNLFLRFLDLLHQTEVKHRTVDYYASVLCVSPKYLSFVCKKNSGKTANEWITEHVLEDIRYYLRSTDCSIKEICTKVGFPNASFFGKFVKTHFGVTPTQFRHG